MNYNVFIKIFNMLLYITLAKISYNLIFPDKIGLCNWLLYIYYLHDWTILKCVFDLLVSIVCVFFKNLTPIIIWRYEKK